MNTFLDQVYQRMVDHLRNGTTDEADEMLEVPIEHFTSPERLQRELEVFRRQPLVGAMSSDVPDPGSFVTLDLMGVPILIVRRKDGTVACFRNMCRHRGGKVEQDERGKKPFFVCAYHGWSYASDGSLRGVPFEEQIGEIDRGCRNLHAVHCEERHGIIWIGFCGDSDRGVAEFLGDADERLGGYGVDRTVVYMEKTIELAVNWKLVMDGAIDILHPQFLHPNGVGKLIQTSAAVWLDYGRHGQSFSARKRLAEKLKAGEEIEAGWRYITGNLVMFPNVSLIPAPDHYEFWNVWPDLEDPGRCTVHIRFLVDGDTLTDEIGKRIERSWEILEQAATEEDFPMEETIQVNAAAYPHGSFTYGKNEVPCQHLHRELDREMASLPA
ncbi:MAG: aromatic ring-hydroxylating dioxygenase subunit alpha [Parasphingopyxis sp.]|uniref:aromatic ring-hydroxylating oxygenase subunit alpha n=1 Tax=Parasphingopyxis sp. TaxID=1920299 RepID=UPI0032EBC44B